MPKYFSTPAGQVTVIAGAVLLLAYLGRRAIVRAGEAVNPLSNENIFYQGTNAVGEHLTGQAGFDLGVWVYDKIHGEG